ncbi:MAG: M48 family metallopeptidase [Gammaproteobacteria bacterium]|nr:M48 family metallopeptidase [Gammaproteobacteria bacterium]
MKKLVSLLIMLAQPLNAALAQDLPDFGTPADAVLNKSREGQIGRSVMLQLYNAGAIVDDPLLTEYVESIGSQIASHANNGDHSFRFFVVDDHRINAFALPGGFIGVNSGLILASDNESELAGVLAHEVSHVTQRHIARSIYDSQRTSIVSMATMLAAVLLGAATDMPSDAMVGAVSASQAAALQRQINFTRQNEHEADRVGIEVLSKAGYDPSGVASFFEKLSKRYGVARQNVPEMLQTHPVTASRIAEARSRARQLPRTRVDDSKSYGLAKARLEVLGAASPQAAAAMVRARPDPESEVSRYALALAMSRMLRNDEAGRMFRELVDEAPGVIAYRIGLAEALTASGLSEDAMQVYEDAVRLFPRNVPLTISYAEALINAGDPGRAHALLLDLLNNVPPTPAQIRLIARAANAEGDMRNAHYYMGEYYVSIGNLPLAINQLRSALETPDAHAVETARLQARLDELMEYVPEEQRDEIARPRDGS